MTETAKRTPGPWKVWPSYSGADYTFIYSDTDKRIALFHKEEDAQAAVVAVECHNDLVAALEHAVSAIEMVIRNRPRTEQAPTNIALDVITEEARAALAKAKL